MQMPSLFKYFAFVGAALLGLLIADQFPARPLDRRDRGQPAAAGEADCDRAARSARLQHRALAQRAGRAEGPPHEPAPATTAAAKSTCQAEPAAAPAGAAKPAAAGRQRRPASAAQAPATPSRALQTTDASAGPRPTRPPRPSARKAEKVKAAKARKARLARERARAEQAAGARDRRPVLRRRAAAQRLEPAGPILLRPARAAAAARATTPMRRGRVSGRSGGEGAPGPVAERANARRGRPLHHPPGEGGSRHSD